MIKKCTLIFTLLIVSQLSFSQSTVNIPDSNFKNYLLDRSSINTNNDSEIQVSEAAAFTGRIDVKGSGKLDSQKVKDLTGLEAFTSLTEFNCEYNELTSLDVSMNVSLISLECSNNAITSLDVSNNLKLEELEFSSNKVSAIDVTKNIELIKIWCKNNLLTSIDVTKNVRLRLFEIERNQLTNINVANNKQLILLNISRNEIASIDISNNTQLSTFYSRVNDLTSIDISKNFRLDDIVLVGNNLTSLDMSKHRYATRLLVFANPGLACIKVVDETVEQKKCSNDRRSGWCVDDNATFSETCGTARTNDKEFYNSILVFPNPISDVVEVSIKGNESIKSIKVFNNLGKLILETQQEKISTSNLSKGMYWLKIESDSNKIAVKSIIK